jgi:thiamine monophosphate kinase
VSSADLTETASLVTGTRDEADIEATKKLRRKGGNSGVSVLLTNTSGTSLTPHIVDVTMGNYVN